MRRPRYNPAVTPGSARANHSHDALVALDLQRLAALPRRRHLAEYVFSAKGAAFIAAWGSAPGNRACESASAERAISFPRLFGPSFLATFCRDLGGEALRVGGVADHIHIVTTLPRTLSQAQMIEQIKKPSSKWIKALEPRYCDFFWQRVYGAFSVSPSQLDAVLQYLETQQEHHRTRTFQEEYRELLPQTRR